MKNPNYFIYVGLLLIIIFIVQFAAELFYLNLSSLNELYFAIVTLRVTIGILTGVVLWVIGRAYDRPPKSNYKKRKYRNL